MPSHCIANNIVRRHCIQCYTVKHGRSVCVLQSFYFTSAQIQPGLRLRINKCGGIWQILGLDRSNIPNPLASLAPPGPFVHSKVPKHCCGGSTALVHASPTHDQLRSCRLPSRKPLMLVQLGQKTVLRLVLVAEPIRTWQKGIHMIATRSVYFPEPYIANIPLGQHVGHQQRIGGNQTRRQINPRICLGHKPLHHLIIVLLLLTWLVLSLLLLLLRLVLLLALSQYNRPFGS